MFNSIEEQLDISTLHFSYLTSHEEVGKLNSVNFQSYDAAVIFTNFDVQLNQLPFHYNPEIHEPQLKRVYALLDKLGNLIKSTGTIYVYGLPQWLPYFSVHLDKQKWQFKYWLALETNHPKVATKPLVSTHEGILLYVKNKDKFSLRKVRSPHQKCEICGDYVADWGGKKHLRNPIGYAISDVWDDLPQVKDAQHVLSKEVWQRLILLTAKNHAHIFCGFYDGVQDLEQFIFQ